MSIWIRFTFACVLGIICGAVFAESSRTEFEQSFIGREWIVGYQPSDQCKESWGGLLQSDDNLGMSSFLCDGQDLVLFEQFITDYAKNNKVKILDALLLPKRKPGERLWQNGDCELKGKIDSDFLVLARLAKHDKVTWKTGVRAAWRPNPETGKFEELSTKDIVCWRPTPP